MRTLLSILIVVLAIPLATFVVLWIREGKVLVVHNTGTGSFEVTGRVENGADVENTDKRVVPAGGWDWMIFFPKTKAAMHLRCIDGSGLSTIELGPDAPTRFLYSNVTLQGCGHVEQKSGFSL
jgi:hypothetical protein